MKKWIKYILITILVILVGAGIFYWYASVSVNKQLAKVYAFNEETIRIPEDSASVELGKRIAVIRGCNECHGNNLEGKVMASDALLGTLVAPNLTRGRGGLPSEYTTSHMLAVLRHGIKRDGTPVIMMPSQETAELTRQDLEALIGYIQQLPPADNVLPANELGPIAVALGFLGQFPLTSVDKINHQSPIRDAVFAEGSAEQGRYLSITCQSCHRPDMKGGESPNPGSPKVPDISSTGSTGSTTLEQFRTTLRKGITPDGRQLKNEDMPWAMTSSLTDPEIQALYRYLRSI